MATVITNALISGLHGKFGRAVVFRTMRGKTFMSALGRKPDKKKESLAQRNTRVNFKDATQWARKILQDPEKKKYYQQRSKALKLPNAYTAALTDYMRKPRVMKMQHGNTLTYSVTKRGFALREVKAELKEDTGVQPRVSVRQHNNTWCVDYKPDKSLPSSLTLVIRDNTMREIKFTDVPI